MGRKTGRFTYLLRWNPEISSTTASQWRFWMEHFRFVEPNWSVRDWQEADHGDQFFMLKEGNGHSGIVMRGYFTSMPYLGSSWRNDGSRIFYRRFRIWHIMDPEDGPIIPIEALQKTLPDIDWTAGHSGVLLTVDQQLALNELWERFEEDHPELIAHQEKMQEYFIEPSAAIRVKGFEKFRDALMWNGDLEYPFTESAMHDCVNLAFSEDYQEHVFRVRVWFMGGKEITFLCTGLEYLRTDLDSAESFMHEFMLFEEGPDSLHLRSNGVDVICSDIEVESVEDSELNGFPVSI